MTCPAWMLWVTTRFYMPLAANVLLAVWRADAAAGAVLYSYGCVFGIARFASHAVADCAII
jgi:hypothetical protein